jgi:hypothetical protein
MSLANAKLMCAVCVQALQLDMAKPSDNAAEFSLTSVKSCKDATQDDDQKLRCVATLIKNADQLLMDQKNGVAPLQSCMNLGLVCMAPTMPPTKAPPTAGPTAPPTAPPTAAPTKVPTAPPPPRTNAMLPGPGVCACGKARIAVGSCDSAECFEACDKKNIGHGVCTTNHALIQVQIPAEPSAQDSIVLPVVVSAAGAAALILSVALWRHYKNKQEPVLEFSDDFQAMPDVEYA